MPLGLHLKRKVENNAGSGDHLTPAVLANAARLGHKTGSAVWVTPTPQQH